MEQIGPSIAFTYDVVFYSLAYSIAFVAGILSTFSDYEYRDVWDLFSIGGISGIVACCVVGALVGSLGGTLGSEPYYLSVAAAIGLLGKSGLRAARSIANNMLKRFENGD